MAFFYVQTAQDMLVSMYLLIQFFLKQMKYVFVAILGGKAQQQDMSLTKCRQFSMDHFNRMILRNYIRKLL